MDVNWERFVADIKKFGFEIIEERDFTVKRRNSTLQSVNLIAAHPSKFLLLHAVSFLFGTQNVINRAKIYGCVNPGNHSIETLLRTLEGCNRGQIKAGQNIWFTLELGSKDLFPQLTRIGQKLSFTTWQNAHNFVNIVGYGHTEESSREKRWRAFRNQTAPQWVRDFINT